MPDSKPQGAVSVIPTIGVTDLDEASAFYRKLGFEEEWRFPEDGEATHAGMSFGKVTVMLSRCSDRRIERQNLYFILKEVVPYHEYLEAVLPEVPPLVDSDYGMRDFAVTDPWGHLLTFGEAS